MKSKKVLGIAVLSTLIVSQLSFSDANIDRLLKEAKKRQAAQKAEVKEVERVSGNLETFKRTDETLNKMEERLDILKGKMD